MEKNIQDILATIDDAVIKFQGGIPDIQRQMMDELIPIIKEFDVKGGKLLNNLQNLRLLGSLKNKLQAIILNKKYKKAVETFTGSFDDLANLQIQYFSQFNKKFKPVNTLPIIKEQAIMTTINDLVGQGMNALVIGSVEEILRQNITTGGSYKDLQTELEDHILDNYKGEGSLTKYTRQITTDAINQFNAQYHETIAADLQFNWGRYVGSLITTSREFCIYLTKKDYFHRAELPEILKGNIDGHQCKLSKTTGIPYGMIPGTNAANFKIRRGGYLCGHQVFWIPDSAVPADIKMRYFKNVKLTPANDPPPVPPPAPVKKPKKQKTTEIAAKVLEQSKASLDDLKAHKVTVYDDLLNKLDEPITFSNSTSKGAFYKPWDKTVVINKNSDRLESEYYGKMIFAHEVGHAIHFTRKIITYTDVDPKFAKHYSDLQKIIKGKAGAIEDLIVQKRAGGATRDEINQLSTIADIVGSLTKGRYGFGHAKSYYKTKNMSEMEIFAHGMSLMRTGNKFSDISPEMTLIVAKMIEYSKTI
jgi:hypothetical protein